MKITVVSGEITTYEGAETSLKLRVYPKHTFIASTEEVIPKASVRSEYFYLEIPCTVTNGIVTFAAFVIDSTLDAISDPARTSYSFALFTDDDEYIGTIYKGIRVPLSTPTTLPALVLYSSTVPAALPVTYYTDDQVDALIASALSALTGDVVEILDAEWVALTRTVYLEEYANLAAAITAIGATPTELKVTTSTAVPATATIPVTTKLVFEGNGKLTVAAGQTLTIGKMDDPGNKQVLVQAASNSNIRFSAGAVNKINIAWFVGQAGECTNAVTQALASFTANGGGTMFFPEGTWLTDGNHAVPSDTVIEGMGNTVVKANGNANGIFTHGAGVYGVKLKDITLDGDSHTIAGYLCSAAYGDGSAGLLRFENVLIQGCTYGFRIYDTLSTEWQMAAVSFDSRCRLSNNTYGVWCNTSNNVVLCEAFFEVGVGQWAGYFLSTGQWTMLGGECAGVPLSGTNQMETQTVVAAAGVTGSGTAQSVVTAAGMIGSPVTVNIPVTTALSTAALVAAEIRQALGKDPSVSSFFHIGGTGADIQLIRLDPAANDGTMNFTINTGTATGITNSATSTNTAAGVADSASASGFYFDNAHGVVNFIGVAEEGFRSFIVNDCADISSVINLKACSIQGAIRLNAGCILNTVGCSIVDRSIRDAAANDTVYTSVGDNVPLSSYYGGAFRTLSARRTTNFNGNTTSGSGFIGYDINHDAHRIDSQFTRRIFQNDTGFFEPRSKPRLELLSSVDPLGGGDWTLFRLGRCTSMGEFLYGYDFKREYTTGRMLISGNQTGNACGIDFNGDIEAVTFRGAEVTPAQITANQNNYDPGTAAENIRLATDASRNLTGLTCSQAGGTRRVIHNVGSFNIVLVNQSGSSTDVNRFLNVTGADITLAPNDKAYLEYDGTTLRWRVSSTSKAGAGGSVTQITSASTSVTLNKITGKITTVGLTTAAGAQEKFSVANNLVGAADTLSISTAYNGGGTPLITWQRMVAANGWDFVITNVHPSDALNDVVEIIFNVHRGAIT